MLENYCLSMVFKVHCFPLCVYRCIIKERALTMARMKIFLRSTNSKLLPPATHHAGSFLVFHSSMCNVVHLSQVVLLIKMFMVGLCWSFSLCFRFTPEMLVTQVREKLGANVTCVIDLTFTNRYYTKSVSK